MGSHTGIDLPVPPGWSIVIGTLGRGFIWLGLLLFAAALVASLWPRLAERKFARVGFVLGCVSLFGAFLSLATLFVADRFEYAYVYQRSDAANELKYKIAAIWSGQQGSFLLWAVCSAIFGLLALKSTGTLRRWYVAAYSLFLASICGILAYETPFNTQPLLDGKLYVPPNGAGLTPSLQNYWVVIHPPTIFLGFGSLTVLFAFAVSAMLNRDQHDWIRQVRPWAILSCSIVGLGLCMGGFWAYETLGWGGFWMWDPVENVSFVPWVLSAVFLHGVIVQVTKKRWVATNYLLAGLPFLIFVYGTFLTRAGFLDGASVHSFAEMDRTAHKVLLGFLALAMVGFMALWLGRGLKLAPKSDAIEEPGIKRQGIYTTSTLLLSALALATAFGMSVPLVQYLIGQKPKVVEEHLYHLVLSWLFVPIMVLMAVGPFVAWRGMSLKELFARIVASLSISMGVLGAMLLVMKSPSLGISADPKAVTELFYPGGPQVSTFNWVTFLVGLTVFAAVANLIRVVEIGRRSKLGIGGFVAHIGLATTMAGLIFSRGFERKEEVFVQDGAPGHALGYTITYKTHTAGFMDRSNKMLFQVEGPDGKFEAKPGLYYTVGQQGEVNPMVWPHIQRHLSHDVYFTLHPQVLEASEPLELKPGETKTLAIDDFASSRQLKYRVTYVKMTREGEPGKVGAKFGGELKFVTDEGETTVAKPSMQLTESGMRREPDIVSDAYYANIVRMNAGDQALTIQLGFIRPVYPIELFYKPLTILVWIGTALMTLGGFLAALARRNRPRRADVLEPVGVESDTIEQDALVPAT